MRKVRAALVLAGMLLFVTAAVQATTLVLFHETGCSHCGRMDAFLESILPNYPELEVLRYEIREPGAFSLLSRLLASYGVEEGAVPMLFIGDVAGVEGVYYGLDAEPRATAGRAEEMALEEAIQKAIAADAPSPLDRIEDVEGASLAERLTIPALVLAALADSVNPCTFAVLVLLLGTLLVAGRKGKMLYAGLAFILAIYVSYFLMGIGIFTVIQAAGIQRIFIMVVSSLAILVGLWNMKDYFAYGKWFTIEVPARWRPTVKRITSSVITIPGAFAVGVLDSIFLLPCSSGPYIAILALLSETTSRGTGLLYLAFYNFIFVLPLLIITLAVHFGYTTTARAERWRSERLKVLHLISGVLMFLMGVGMIIAVQLGYM